MKPYEIEVGVKMINENGEYEYFVEGEKISIITDETDFEKEYVGVIELINEDGIWLLDNPIGIIPLEYIVDVKKVR